MSRPLCYLLMALVYDICLLGAHDFYALDLAICLAAWMMSERKFKVLLWVAGLNLFTLAACVSLALNGDIDGARVIFVRCNLILLLVVSLFLGRGQYFLIKALFELKFPQKLLLVLVINARLFDELLSNLAKMPSTIKARGVSVGINLTTYKAYANLIAKNIVFGFDRAGEIYATMRVRGYDGTLGFLPDKKANLSELLLLSLVVINAVFRAFV